ncbi:hypothetical protein MCT05_17630 [Vibrio aestuarianus]|nr:hypothetical protein [Vibrio aestuarianus]
MKINDWINEEDLIKIIKSGTDIRSIERALINNLITLYEYELKDAYWDDDKEYYSKKIKELEEELNILGWSGSYRMEH